MHLKTFIVSHEPEGFGKRIKFLAEKVGNHRCGVAYDSRVPRIATITQEMPRAILFDFTSERYFSELPQNFTRREIVIITTAQSCMKDWLISAARDHVNFHIDLVDPLFPLKASEILLIDDVMADVPVKKITVLDF